MRILSPGTTRANVIRSALTGLLIAGTVARRAAAATPATFSARAPPTCAAQSIPVSLAPHVAARITGQMSARRDPSGTND